MKIGKSKYIQILQAFKQKVKLSELMIFNFDCSFDCFFIEVPTSEKDCFKTDNQSHIVLMNGLNDTVVAIYTKDEFLSYFSKSIQFAETKYFGTGMGQDTEQVYISSLLTCLKGCFCKNDFKEIMIQLKTATTLLKLYGYWQHPVFENTEEPELINYYRKYIQDIFVKFSISDVFRERENAAFKSAIISRLQDLISSGDLIKTKKELSRLEIAWMDYGFVGDDRKEQIEYSYQKLKSEFQHEYDVQSKIEGSDVNKYEKSIAPHWVVREIKQQPWDFSGDDLSIDPRFW